MEKRKLITLETLLFLFAFIILGASIVALACISIYIVINQTSLSAWVNNIFGHPNIDDKFVVALKDMLNAANHIDVLALLYTVISTLFIAAGLFLLRNVNFKTKEMGEKLKSTLDSIQCMEEKAKEEVQKTQKFAENSQKKVEKNKEDLNDLVKKIEDLEHRTMFLNKANKLNNCISNLYFLLTEIELTNNSSVDLKLENQITKNIVKFRNDLKNCERITQDLEQLKTCHIDNIDEIIDIGTLNKLKSIIDEIGDNLSDSTREELISKIKQLKSSLNNIVSNFEKSVSD